MRYDGSVPHSSIAKKLEEYLGVLTDLKVLTYPKMSEVAKQPFIDMKEYLDSKKRSSPVNIIYGIVFRLTGKYCL